MKRLLYFFCVLSACFAAMPLLGQSIPEIPYDSTPNLLKMPNDIYLGEVLGVSTNSKGHIYVYTRTGSVNLTTGTNRVFVRSASRLFEFDQTGKYVREIGQGVYGFIQAHTVRVDPQDNIWVVDEGSNMIMKFDPEGRVVMNLGRKPEAINNPVRPAAQPAAGAPPAANKQFCLVCHAELPPNIAFCHSCGAPVQAANSSHSPTVRAGNIEGIHTADQTSAPAADPASQAVQQAQENKGV